MKFKKSLYLLLLIPVFVFISSCSDNNKVERKVLYYGSTKDIRDINPHLYNGEIAAQNIVFEGLTEIKDGEVKPALAKSWDISKDQKVYTFHLREGIKFTDGEPFNAKVVKQNFDAILANKERHSWLDLANEIKDTKMIDDYTFELTLKHPYYPTLIELGMTRPFRFVSPNCFIDGQTKNGIKDFIGTGVYKLESHKDNQQATFVENEEYWGEQPNIPKIEWKVIPDSQTLLLAFQKGEIDIIYGADGDQLSIDSFDSMENNDKYNYEIGKPIASRSILLNSERKYLSDINVRKAVTYAINKKDIVSGILKNSEKKAGTLLPKTTPYSDIDVTPYPFDVKKANDLLDEIGWEKQDNGIREKDGEQLQLLFSYNSQNVQEGNIAEIIQSNLKEIGVDLKIIAEEKQNFLDRQKTGDFDLQYSLSWGTPYDPQSYLSSWRIPAHGDYQAQLGLDKKEWVDQTITDIMIEPNEKKRERQYKEVLTYLHNEFIYVPISYSRTRAVAQSYVKNIEFADSQYEIPFDKLTLE